MQTTQKKRRESSWFEFCHVAPSSSFFVIHVCSSPCRVGDVFEGGAGGGQKACALRKELSDLGRVEKSLDELIQSSTAQLKQLTEFEDNKRYPFTIACFLRLVVHPFVRPYGSKENGVLVNTWESLWALTLRCTLGYVTYQDLRSIASLRDQTVIAVKAPADTKLEVPDTAGVRDSSHSAWPSF